MKRIALINPDNLSEKDVEMFEERIAARAIVFDADNKIALLHVTKNNYHKLPGGGIDEGETMEEGLARELKEEIGCEAEVGELIGDVIEYRRPWNQLQQSYVYIAKVVGEKCEPAFTDLEKEGGFEVMWVTFDEALELIKNDEPSDLMGSFVVPRDLAILEEVKSR